MTYPYGFCPKCGSVIIARERRPDGNDTCAHGHIFPSREASMPHTRPVKVFLGGTCNESTWRDRLIPMLKVNFFDPVVDDWTPAHQQEEIRQREICDICLTVITPKMTGVYSIAEVVDDSNKRPWKTVFCCLYADDGAMFDEGQYRSLKAVSDMVERNGGKVCHDLSEVANYINRMAGRRDMAFCCGVPKTMSSPILDALEEDRS